ncbi:hypothetical protein H8B15_19695 [Hymenobacter sp. BT507]|uniref:Alpha/beta hydrolase n=1 Tax=Hymenobacter citatus TaxID=2763506 RepID=A0ABR7MPZ6_9BACT|nr:hypothetical protein [Hymenobacter citatus]MBC6613155.1 hypothetical protein [Hymenobacter citatus]
MCFLFVLLVTLYGGWFPLPMQAQAVRNQTPRVTKHHLLAGSSKRVFYQLPAATSEPHGLLVLLPGRGEKAHTVFQATRLPNEAARRGFLVVVIDLHEQVYLGPLETRVLDETIRTVVQQHPALAQRLVVGGFSAGGQLAFAYAETVLRDSTQRPWRVQALLGVDPPLDLARHWQRAQRHVEQRDCPTLLPGDQRIVAELTQTFGGTPVQVPAVYQARSAYTRSDSTGGNASYLRALPVRLYCEPDLAFWQHHYCATLQASDFNAPDAKSLILRLQKLGNRQAQYIQTTGKGYVGKHRMPHAWSIVDASDCALWLEQVITQ